MARILLTFLFICGIYQATPLQPATYLPDGLTFHEAANLYYQTYPEFVYGHVTRFGSDDLAFDELYRTAQEFRSQTTRGYGLLGGGYGYRWIGDREYLIDNRASEGYSLMANKISEPFPAWNDNQWNLYKLAMMSRKQAREYIETDYAGIISVKSPNDIGRKFCLMELPQQEIVGVVIVGGVAARNDWMYYGPSLNDSYKHPRIGQRVSKLAGVEYYWLADLSDSVWGDGMQYAVLLPPEYCSCKGEIQ